MSRGPRQKNIKTCVVCGKPFASPPSTNRLTCSKACSAIRRSQAHTGISNVWSDAAKARVRAAGRTAKQAESSKSALADAMAIPEGQRGPQNRECKLWRLRDPSGTVYEAQGLLPWCRENYRRFEPDATDPEASAKRISAGLRAVASSMRGVPSRSARPAMTYKGWTILDLPSKP